MIWTLFLILITLRDFKGTGESIDGEAFVNSFATHSIRRIKCIDLVCRGHSNQILSDILSCRDFNVGLYRVYCKIHQLAEIRDQSSFEEGFDDEMVVHIPNENVLTQMYGQESLRVQNKVVMSKTGNIERDEPLQVTFEVNSLTFKLEIFNLSTGITYESEDVSGDNEAILTSESQFYTKETRAIFKNVTNQLCKNPVPLYYYAILKMHQGKEALAELRSCSKQRFLADEPSECRDKALIGDFYYDIKNHLSCVGTKHEPAKRNEKCFLYEENDLITDIFDERIARPSERNYLSYPFSNYEKNVPYNTCSEKQRSCLECFQQVNTNGSCFPNDASQSANNNHDSDFIFNSIPIDRVLDDLVADVDENDANTRCCSLYCYKKEECQTYYSKKCQDALGSNRPDNLCLQSDFAEIKLIPHYAESLNPALCTVKREDTRPHLRVVLEIAHKKSQISRTLEIALPTDKSTTTAHITNSVHISHTFQDELPRGAGLIRIERDSQDLKLTFHERLNFESVRKPKVLSKSDRNKEKVVLWTPLNPFQPSSSLWNEKDYCKNLNISTLTSVDENMMELPLTKKLPLEVETNQRHRFTIYPKTMLNITLNVKETDIFSQFFCNTSNDSQILLTQHSYLKVTVPDIRVVTRRENSRKTISFNFNFDKYPGYVRIKLYRRSENLSVFHAISTYEHYIIRPTSNDQIVYQLSRGFEKDDFLAVIKDCHNKTYQIDIKFEASPQHESARVQSSKGEHKMTTVQYSSANHYLKTSLAMVLAFYLLVVLTFGLLRLTICKRRYSGSSSSKRSLLTLEKKLVLITSLSIRVFYTFIITFTVAISLMFSIPIGHLSLTLEPHSQTKFASPQFSLSDWKARETYLSQLSCETTLASEVGGQVDNMQSISQHFSNQFFTQNKEMDSFLKTFSVMQFACDNYLDRFRQDTLYNIVRRLDRELQMPKRIFKRIGMNLNTSPWFSFLHRLDKDETAGLVKATDIEKYSDLITWLSIQSVNMNDQRVMFESALTRLTNYSKSVNIDLKDLLRMSNESVDFNDRFEEKGYPTTLSFVFQNEPTLPEELRGAEHGLNRTLSREMNFYHFFQIDFIHMRMILLLLDLLLITSRFRRTYLWIRKKWLSIETNQTSGDGLNSEHHKNYSEVNGYTPFNLDSSACIEFNKNFYSVEMPDMEDWNEETCRNKSKTIVSLLRNIDCQHYFLTVILIICLIILILYCIGRVEEWITEMRDYQTNVESLRRSYQSTTYTDKDILQSYFLRQEGLMKVTTQTLYSRLKHELGEISKQLCAEYSPIKELNEKLQKGESSRENDLCNVNLQQYFVQPMRKTCLKHDPSVEQTPGEGVEILNNQEIFNTYKRQSVIEFLATSYLSNQITSLSLEQISLLILIGSIMIGSIVSASLINAIFRDGRRSHRQTVISLKPPKINYSPSDLINTTNHVRMSKPFGTPSTIKSERISSRLSDDFAQFNGAQFLRIIPSIEESSEYEMRNSCLMSEHSSAAAAATAELNQQFYHDMGHGGALPLGQIFILQPSNEIFINQM